MKTVDSNFTISEQLCEFIDLSDAELKRVTGGWGHNEDHHRKDHEDHHRRNREDHNSCDSCDWNSCGSCDWNSCNN